MGNLIADALKAAVGADVALTNGGGIRADKQYQAGQKLTRRDILSEMPFGNTTVLLEVTGAQIKDALENGVSQVRELGGRFPQVSGIVAEVDVKEPVGSRVKSVKINGQPLDPAKTYKLATNDFVARGGDGYRAFANAKSLINVSASQLMASQVIDYVAKAGKVAPKVEGRVVLR
jgi:2',3'-cyclic-nucleotide 2'-phosphodiesterase (5'-nucleotidase family)